MNQASIHRSLAQSLQKNPTPNQLHQAFERRLTANYTLLQDLFFSLYPEDNYSKTFDRLTGLLLSLFRERSQELQVQDLRRLEEGNWYQSEKWVGMQLYVDRFCKDLKTLESKVDYLERLGVNFLHLMPITTRPQGENDGGYL